MLTSSARRGYGLAMENPLRSYLKRHKIRQGEFARLMGVSHSRISEWCNGRKRPADDMKIRIADATGGAVPVTAWFRRAA